MNCKSESNLYRPTMRPFVFTSFIMLLLCYQYAAGSSETVDKHLVGKFSTEDRLSSSLPCLCEKNNYDVLSKYRKPLTNGYRNPLIADQNSHPSSRLASSMSEKERKEKLDESMARFMQLMTFFGHVDNFITQKTSGLLKIMGKAVDPNDYEEDYEPRYQPAKRTMPRIMTTISS